MAATAPGEAGSVATYLGVKCNEFFGNPFGAFFGKQMSRAGHGNPCG
jgi:hypothetical protein